MSDFTWQGYWSGRTDGGHRQQSEEFLQQEAREKLYHLDGGESILDFGCGSADLLAHYASAYSRLVGADFSPSMLAGAARRLARFHCSDRVTLVEADDRSVWEKVPGTFDRITAGQVIQYLTPVKIEAFLDSAAGRLNEGGRIVLFDIIDPRIFFLFELGLFGGGDTRTAAAIARLPILLLRRLVRRLRGLPAAEMGYLYRPEEIAPLAALCGLEMEVVWSMHYEYRYHAILRWAESPGGERGRDDVR